MKQDYMLVMRASQEKLKTAGYITQDLTPAEAIAFRRAQPRDKADAAFKELLSLGCSLGGIGPWVCGMSDETVYYEIW